MQQKTNINIDYPAYHQKLFLSASELLETLTKLLAKETISLSFTLDMYMYKIEIHIYQIALFALGISIPTKSFPRESKGGKSPLVVGSEVDDKTVPKSGSNFIAFGVFGSKIRGDGVAGDVFEVEIVWIDTLSMPGTESLDFNRFLMFNGVGAL